MTVRLIKREAVFKCESYEVHFPDGRPSRFFYWDDGDRLTSCLDRRVMYLRATASRIALVITGNSIWTSPATVEARALPEVGDEHDSVV
jgi:hypothetical protein